MRYDPRLETAVYLGQGVWRQLDEREARSGRFDHLPQRFRPFKERQVVFA